MRAGIFAAMLSVLAFAYSNAALAATPGPAAADSAEAAILTQRAEDIGKVFTGEIAYDDAFSAEFIAAVPKSQMDAITAQLVAQLGEYQGVHDVAPRVNGSGIADIRFQFGDMLANAVMHLSPGDTGEVIGFRIVGFTPILATGETVAGKIAELPGVTNLLFTRLDGSAPLEAHNADMPLAIASAFKLWVLSALVRNIEADNHAWDEVVILRDPRAPVGGMENWPADSPVTLSTLATMMIATSDNSATDKLIEVLGRAAIEAELVHTAHSNPASNVPFLTIREFMLLKWREERGEIDYAALDETGRRSALAQIANSPMTTEMATALFGGGPKHIDIEWFATPRDLASVMMQLHNHPKASAILAANRGFPPGVAEDWSYVGYKGGSEPGVLNFTWLLSNDVGEDFVLTMSWNNPAANVDEAVFMGMAQLILAQHRQSSMTPLDQAGSAPR